MKRVVVKENGHEFLATQNLRGKSCLSYRKQTFSSTCHKLSHPLVSTMDTTLEDIGLGSGSCGESDDDLAEAPPSLVDEEAHDAFMDTEDEADEEREATSGGDELGNLPGLIDYDYVDDDDDPGLHRRVTLDADENGNLPRPLRRLARSDVPVGIAKADLVYDLEWQQSGEKFDSTTSFPRPSKSNSG